jgi:hypothetical protein
MENRKNNRRTVARTGRKNSVGQTMRGIRNSQSIKAVTTAGNAAVNSTGSILLLNGTVPGTDVSKRLGRSIYESRLDMFLYHAVTAATGTDQVHRFLIVHDKQPNGTALAITDVLDSVLVNSQFNLSNRARFIILWDYQVQLNAATEPYSNRFKHLEIPLNKRVTFNAGTAGTIADIASGSLYFLAIGNNVAGVTAGAFDLQCRVFFEDME